MTNAKTRMTAAEREVQIVRAAVTAFAASGYKGTTTDEVARLAGVSQPYVIRLFGSKQRLFLAACEYVCGRIEQTFRHAAQERADLATLGDAYDALLAERELLLVFLHGLVSSADPAIGEVIRPRFGRIFQVIRELTGAPAEDVHTFIAKGMLITILTAMRAIGPDAVPAEPAMIDLLDTLPFDHRPSDPDESARS
jgi:AcrR family transcriptional regulator